jgi:SAM-dependent methyltransferase
MSFNIPDQDAVSWFDRLYAAADRDRAAIPWASLEPCPWVPGMLERFPGPGRAVIVGCGLGDDAEAVAAAGYDTVAFDVSDEAVSWAKDRHPDSPVEYAVRDLLRLPAEMRRNFDLVVEVRTIQSLPPTLRAQAITGVADLIAPGGRALVVALSRPDGTVPSGPPWPVASKELDGFVEAGLTLIEDQSDAGHLVRLYSRQAGSE